MVIDEKRRRRPFCQKRPAPVFFRKTWRRRFIFVFRFSSGTVRTVRFTQLASSRRRSAPYRGARPVRPAHSRSSRNESGCFLNRRSEVRVLSGPPIRSIPYASRLTGYDPATNHQGARWGAQAATAGGSGSVQTGGWLGSISGQGYEQGGEPYTGRPLSPLRWPGYMP